MVTFPQQEPLEISVRTDGEVPDQLIQRARRRVATSLGRFAGRIRSVRVRLSDINGPRGGADKQCTVAVRLAVTPRLLLIEDVSTSFEVSVDRAADRSGRSVARAVRAFHGWAPQPFAPGS